MEKQQTAVDWLREQFHKVPTSQFGILFKRAKEMERQQIEEAYDFGVVQMWASEKDKKNGADYFTEKYGDGYETANVTSSCCPACGATNTGVIRVPVNTCIDCGTTWN